MSRGINIEATSREMYFTLLGIRGLAQGLHKKYEQEWNQYEHDVFYRCSFCSKLANEPLPACSLCKSARYCNETCQRADFTARHRRQCIKCTYPPHIPTFVTVPIGDKQYPERPIFAQGSRDGVGFWVSVEGRIDCRLTSLVEPMTTSRDDDVDMGDRNAQVNRDLALAAKHGVFDPTLLTLSVAVQNRRKDKKNVLIFPAQIDNSRMRQLDGQDMAVLGVSQDPWTKGPRVLLMNVNGTEIGPDTPLPSSVLDRKQCIVELKSSEYVQYSIQFRIGDNENILQEFRALAALQGMSVAFAPLPGNGKTKATPAGLDRSLAMHLERWEHPPSKFGLILRFDQEELMRFYADAIFNGEEAHMESHVGKERVIIMRKMEELALGEVRAMWQDAQDTGEAKEVVEKMRKVGLGEMVDEVNLNWSAREC
ncbi:hypothetical protein C8Q80DRAFT_1352876 [Daedaleopsis nitida]|nr:hypothetical protein C8Q80DRAFT_1352876 [Daedaleopsis nitida]